MAKKPGYHDSVFVNCPFDAAYLPMFRAIIFAIYRCGFYPVSALAEDNALDNRIDKIIRLIGACRYGIHDISRTESNRSGYPRFNMPFELGLFFGARRFGNQRQRTKNSLIFERTPYSYQQLISDINGIDPNAHHDDPFLALRLTKEWLSSVSHRSTLPTFAKMTNDYNQFVKNLPAIAKNVGYDLEVIPFADLCRIVEKAIDEKSSG